MSVLRPDGAGEAADLAAFLGRLVRWDKAAVVRLRAGSVPDGGSAVAVFGRPPFGEVLAVRTYPLAEPLTLDATVPAGPLLDAVDASDGVTTVPPGVTGPAWAGVLPPRDGWLRTAELDAGRLRTAAAAVVGEFRARTEALAPRERTRAVLDALADEVWSRRLAGTRLPLRAVHAAHALGFLRPVRAVVTAGSPGPPGGEDPPVLLARGPWLRLRTPYGSVAVRERTGAGLPVSPSRPAARPDRPAR